MEAQGSTDEDRHLIIQAKKTLDYFLENPESPPILSHLVDQLELPPTTPTTPPADRESYPPTVILLIVSLFALQKHSKLERDLQQEKVLQVISEYCVLLFCC